MNLTFRIRFATKPGQSLAFTGESPLPDRQTMEFYDREFWQTKIPLAENAGKTSVSYSCIFQDTDGTRINDWGRHRNFIPANFNCEELLIIDAWNVAGFYENAFYTEPFKNVLLAENFTEVKTVAPENPTHTFRAKSPLLKKGETICLLGEGNILGNWQTQSPVLLGRQKNEDHFSATLDLRGQHFPFAYKYGIFDVKKKSFVCFEAGENRILADEISPNKHTLVSDGFVNLPANTWHGAGVAIPVFSLRSEKSFGVGEFSDLKPLADWGKKIGLKLIQLLPVNDTSATHSWKDSYPYAAISAFALHPIYLNLAAVANAKNQPALKFLESERARLNSRAALDYAAVMKLKMDFLRKIFPSQKKETFQSTDYKKFFSGNEHWLLPYAAFCFLRDKFGTANFNEWPEHKNFDAKKISALAKNNDEIAFHFFVQFHLHTQLQAATAYAHANGIVVKGDIAIGVARHGADAWQAPELFNMDVQAGAPPDPFSDKGQNWNFPTYNWPRMAADGFAWWKRRFAQMGNYFDAFRIDHILGFFRIWSIPLDAVEGILGHFVPAIPLAEKEFSERGIRFDRDRFLQPFINGPVLKEIFGGEADFIRTEFLDRRGENNYSLKPQFLTQQKIEKHFFGLPQNQRAVELKLGLFDLISNVILIEADGKLHFRFFVEKTLSFKNLDLETQKKLRELYVDYFFRRQDDFWKSQALQKLPALKRVTDMLICGEDLGLVPACVPEVMRDLGFLSLEIQRMPKSPGEQFLRPGSAPYLSVVTPSTHDMSTIRGWWTEDRALTQKFFNDELGLRGEAPTDASPEIVEAVLRQHLASPAMWSIFQLQELLGMDGELRRKDIDAERINVPAIPNFYWSYRMHLTLEGLQRAEKFNSRLAEMLRENGR